VLAWRTAAVIAIYATISTAAAAIVPAATATPAATPPQQYSAWSDYCTQFARSSKQRMSTRRSWTGCTGAASAVAAAATATAASATATATAATRRLRSLCRRRCRRHDVDFSAAIVSDRLGAVPARGRRERAECGAFAAPQSACSGSRPSGSGSSTPWGRGGGRGESLKYFAGESPRLNLQKLLKIYIWACVHHIENEVVFK